MAVLDARGEFYFKSRRLNISPRDSDDDALGTRSPGIQGNFENRKVLARGPHAAVQHFSRREENWEGQIAAFFFFFLLKRAVPWL